MNKVYKFKGKQFNITEELAEDLGINKATDFIFTNEDLSKHCPYKIDDCMFRLVGLTEWGAFQIRIYEPEETL